MSEKRVKQIVVEVLEELLKDGDLFLERVMELKRKLSEQDTTQDNAGETTLPPVKA